MRKKGGREPREVGKTRARISTLAATLNTHFLNSSEQVCLCLSKA